MSNWSISVININAVSVFFTNKVKGINNKSQACVLLSSFHKIKVN